MIAAAHLAALDRDGCTILRGAVPGEWIVPLREIFERRDTPSEGWPAPREWDTRHAILRDDEEVRRVCLLPVLLAGVRHVLKRPFRLKTVEGRDPKPDGGQQNLHRDWAYGDGRPMSLVKALAFLDDFDAANGATRIVSGSHLEDGGWAEDDPRQFCIAGAAGDVFLFHGRLVHSGTRNRSGVRRRALQIWYRADV